MNVGEILTFEYTGGEQTVILAPGRYKLDTYGGQGGSGTDPTYGLGGKGGRAYGELSLSPDKEKDTTLYVNVAGAGSRGSFVLGGYGYGGRSGYNSSYATSGGGATSIAFESGLLDVVEPIIAAGGGGGGCFYSTSYYGNGGAGGGLEGGNGYCQYGGGYTTGVNCGQGGTQTEGGQPGGVNGYVGYAGVKGIAGWGNLSETSRNCACGGGGGYYAGAGTGYYNGTYYYRYFAGGGGGSSYLGTLENGGTTAGVREGNGLATIECLELYEFGPDPVREINQIAKTFKQIGIQWSASERATSYKVYRDGAFVRSVTDTVFYETFANYNEEHTYSVIAVNDSGESEPAEIYCETQLYFDVLDLITDRTASDVDALKSLIEKGEDLTEEEITRFLTDSKGAYNYSDMNRVALATMYIASELASIGEIIEVVMKKNWNENNIPKTSEIETYLRTIRKVRNMIKVSITNAPNQLRSITDANAIEQMLVDIDELIKRQLYFLNYSGDIFSGEV